MPSGDPVGTSFHDSVAHGSEHRGVELATVLDWRNCAVDGVQLKPLHIRRDFRAEVALYRPV